jgi:acetylornithine/succinyldiaminopimelate/putrescine aminotransferase
MIDEVQTGLGRCGAWFAHQRAGVRPDVVTMAKALGNGVPIGACWARSEVASVFEPGDHATTFGGQPLAAAAARAVLSVMEAEDVPARAQRAGKRFADGLDGAAGVVGIRGAGLLLAVELDLVEGRVSADVARELLAGDHGLRAVVNAITPTALRLAPSLLISDQEIDRAVEVISAAVGAG